MSTMLLVRFSVLLSAILVLTACGGGNDAAPADAGTVTPGEWVVVHALSDPEGVNPIVTNDASASAILNHVFETLLVQDFTTTELVPRLAEARPTVSEDHLQYTFTLKPGITFSDGSPLTTADVLFSFKAVKNPLVIDAAPIRNYYLDVADIQIQDDRTFTVVMTQPYFLAEYFLGGLWIMSKKHLDPKGLSDGFTIAQTNNIAAAEKNPAMQAFATWFNSADVKRGLAENVGSGPYIYDSWDTGQALTLRKNPSWWNVGNEVLNPAYPEKIIYKVVNDRNTAVVAVKNQEIDFMEAVPASKYAEEIDTTAMTHLAKTAFENYTYLYIGWNMRNPIFADKRVRRALSHLVDRDALIQQVVRGLATPANSPVYPGMKEYDTTIPGFTYDPAQARTLLDEAGWSAVNSNGIRTKVINGKTVELSFKFLLNAGNEQREQIMLILADEFKKVGIKADIQKLEWSVFLENLRSRQFDAYIGAWVNDPLPTDPYQLWHSSQAENGGSNYTGFSNQRADQLIEANRLEFDEAKRIAMMKEFQRIVVDEQPYTFLWRPLRPTVYNKRLQNVQFSLTRPGYEPSQWWVPTSQWRFSASR